MHIIFCRIVQSARLYFGKFAHLRELEIFADEQIGTPCTTTENGRAEINVISPLCIFNVFLPPAAAVV